MKLATFAIAVLALAIPRTLSAVTIYQTVLSGASEVPPTGSSGTGFMMVTLDGNLLSVDVSFSGLTTPANAAHIHCCVPAGVNAPVAIPFNGFPAALSGSFTQSYDLTLLSSYNAPFVAANGGTVSSAQAALVAALNSDMTYGNIHNAAFPGGEIRGQLQLIPEPATAGLLLLALAPALVLARKRRKT